MVGVPTLGSCRATASAHRLQGSPRKSPAYGCRRARTPTSTGPSPTRPPSSRAGSAGTPAVPRPPPNAAAELSCWHGGDPVLTGPRTGHALELLSPGTVVVGARLRPGAAPALLGVPASALVDVATLADEVLSTGALAERIAAASSPWAAAGELEAFLLA